LDFKIHYLNQILSITALIIVYSCAAIQGPSGGPKDETPPELVQTIPSGGSIHFKGEQVELIFSEFIDANSIEKAIHVLPILPEAPKIIYKGRRVFVEFPDTLIENQTYIISIGRTLKDEHNVALAQGIQVAFSTGDEIDKGEISGTVVYDKPSSVHLWKIQHEKDLTEFYQRIPDYVLDTSDSGKYKFQYLSDGNYRLAAVDRSTSGSPISLDRMVYGLSWNPLIQIGNSKEITGQNIRVPNNMGGIKMNQAEWKTGNWSTISFSDNIIEWETALKIHAIYEDSSIHQPSQFLNILDGTKLHLTFSDLDKSQYVTILTNGIMQGEETIIDSGLIKLRVDTTIDTTNLSVNAPTKNFVLSIEEDNIIPLEIVFSNLINTEKSHNSFVLMQDSISIPFKSAWITPLHSTITPLENWEPRTFYKILLFRDEIYPIFGQTLKDSIKTISFKTSDFKGYGRFIGASSEKLSSKTIAEIASMEKEPSVFRSVVNLDGNFDINRVPEGDYSLSFFQDLDGNDRYSYGRVDPYKPSEWFYTYPDTVSIRTNWDIEINSIKLE